MSSISRPSTPLSASSAAPIPINHPAHTLLSRAHSPTTATTLFTDKIKKKPLLIHPSSTAASQKTDSRALRRHIRLCKKQYHLQHRKPRPLSAKEKRQLKLYDLDPATVTYEIYQPLNRLWRGYILEVLGLQDRDDPNKVSTDVLEGKKTVTPASHGSLLASADFHGMEVEVVRSRDVGRVGLRGIVIRETRSTLAVVTPSNRCIRVMKGGTVFRVVIDLTEDDAQTTTTTIAAGRDGGESSISTTKITSSANSTSSITTNIELPVDSTTKIFNNNKPSSIPISTPKPPSDTSKPRRIVFDLHGSQLEIRPVERAVRKFKWKSMEHL